MNLGAARALQATRFDAAVVDGVLATVMTADHGRPPELTWAWQRLCSSAGRIRVGPLAAASSGFVDQARVTRE